MKAIVMEWGKVCPFSKTYWGKRGTGNDTITEKLDGTQIGGKPQINKPFI